MTTGEKIASCRKKLGITQDQLAGVLGVTRQAVSRWESDSAFPETDTLIKISRLFGVSCDWILNYDGQNEQGIEREQGVQTTQEAPAVQIIYRTEEVKKPAFSEKAVNYTAVAASMMLALFSLVFVFLIGFSVPTNLFDSSGLLSGLDFSSGGANTYIYYYFGDGYKALANLSSASKLLGDFTTAAFTTVVIGTIISIFTLIVVVSFSIASIVFGAKHLLGKSKSYGAGLAFGAFLLYIAGTALILSLNNTGLHSSILNLNLQLRINDATIAGVVLCSVAALVYIICNMILNRKALSKGGTVTKIIFAFVSVALVTVVFALSSLPAYSLQLVEGENVSVSFGTTNLLMLIALFNKITTAPSSGTVSYAVYVVKFSTVHILVIFALLALVAMMIIGANIIIRNIFNMTKEEGKNPPLVLNIIFLCLSVLYLVMLVLCGKNFLKLEDMEGFTLTYAVPILMVVFSALSLAICIVNKRIKKKSVPAEPAQVQNG